MGRLPPQNYFSEQWCHSRREDSGEKNPTHSSEQRQSLSQDRQNFTLLLLYKFVFTCFCGATYLNHSLLTARQMCCCWSTSPAPILTYKYQSGHYTLLSSRKNVPPSILLRVNEDIIPSFIYKWGNWACYVMFYVITVLNKIFCST